MRCTMACGADRSRWARGSAAASAGSCGAILLPPSLTSTRRAYTALVEERASLLIFVDELVKGRINAPAFGRPLRPRGNIANVARLALASGAVVIPAHVERCAKGAGAGGGARFHVTFEPRVELIRGGDEAATLATNVATLDALIAPIVLARLDQW